MATASSSSLASHYEPYLRYKDSGVEWLGKVPEKWEVDGLLGPLPRQALAEYQRAAGLYATQTIDQPTLESLGLAG